MRQLTAFLLAFVFLGPVGQNFADDLSYLAAPCDPYYPDLEHPKLVTPQWVGDPEVDAVVIMSIDDMRDSAKYETYLRPIINRLKEIDGRGPVSIFCNEVDPADETLQGWLKEGLSLETHTVDHPCPLLCDGDLAKAKSTYDRCVDQLSSVPGSKPVAFRMPCCDSLNTPSPRFWTEIFSKQTPNSNWLAIDSSVFNIFTPEDSALKPSITRTADGKPRFRSYLPFPWFVNTIENYPYPYIINGDCWEFPCIVPSDWEAQNVQQPNNPKTIDDWKVALEATVAKQGVMPIVFHPHNWIRSQQVASFVNWADKTYGKRVKFLTFKEALGRINEHLLGGVPLRGAQGNSHGVRLLDVNGDGFMDVVRRSGDDTLTRVWHPGTKDYKEHLQPVRFEEAWFGRRSEIVHLFARTADQLRAYKWDEGWKVEYPDLPPVEMVAKSLLRDIDGDGSSEWIISTNGKTTIWSQSAAGFTDSKVELPFEVSREDGRDSGVRFVDLNGDDYDDVIQSDGTRYGVWVFDVEGKSWSEVRSGKISSADAIASIAKRDGSNNGAWFHTEHLWLQNEDTHRLADLVDRVSYSNLLAKGDSTEVSGDKAAVLGSAKTLAESLKTFDLLPGTKLQVAAAEPQISDPVAFDWGPNGELWVAEMGDYPNGANWHGPGDKKDDPGGRVKLLYDKDGDGRFETATTFLDKLTVPTAVKAYKNGVLIIAAPDILFAIDTNGDGVADKSETLYTGLAPGNHQHRANGLRWGLDHWLHIANGESGGKLKSLKTGVEVSIRGRDVKIHPETGGLKVIAGQTQYGRSRDNLGNWFGGNNSNPVWHYVLDLEYLARNPHVSPPSSRKQISTEPGASPVFPSSETVERFNDFDRANRFTSACSTEISRDDADKQQFVYICEPVHNLVHRSLLTADGITFVSSRAEKERQTEFVRSSDNWFRPVMVRGGPDGAIWIADMYRQVIEHPEWIPMDWQTKLDHLAGNDKGRIYRVVFDDKQPNNEWQDVGQLNDSDLIKQLDTSNGPLRDIVQQEIYERRPKNARVDLREFGSQLRWPLARIPAMYLLEEVDGIDEQYLHESFENQTVDEHVLGLAAAQLGKSEKLRDDLFNWLESSELTARQRMAAAYALGDVKDDRTASAIVELSRLATDDEYLRAAVLSSVRSEDLPRIVAKAIESHIDLPSRDDFLTQLMSTAIGQKNVPALNNFSQFLAGIDDETTAVSWFAEFNESSTRHNTTLFEVFSDYEDSPLPRIVSAGRKIALDRDEDLSNRVDALRTFNGVARFRPEELEVVKELLSPQTPVELQVEAIRMLRELSAGDAIVAKQMFGKWRTLTPAVRRQLLQQALENDLWTNALLEAMENLDISSQQVDLLFQRRLRQHNSASVRERAEQLFAEVPSDREAVIAKYSNLPESDDLVLGKAVFAKRCSVCHELEGQGRAVGPDLRALSDKSRPAMLTAILDPNKAVEEKFLDYVVVLEDGRSEQGMLAEELATALKLETAAGETKTILRNQIDSIQTTGKSLMPEGLEQVMTRDELAAVIHYVQSAKANRKRFEGNTPQVAPVRDDDSIRLFAMHAEIYGPNLLFESKYRNLGFWKSDRDRAVWTIDAPRAGKYVVNFDFACAPQEKSNRFQLLVNDQKLAGEISSTGSWDNYDSKDVGTIWLPDEPVQVTITSDGPVQGFLFDLRTVIIWPEE